MTDCSICCEKFNKSNRCKINCKTCEDDQVVACQSCAKRYILDQPTDPSCMICKVEWDTEFLTNNFTNIFISKELKVHRENYLLDKQIALLPETQEYAEQLKLIDGLEKQKIIIFEERRKLELKLRKLNSSIREIDITIGQIRNGTSSTNRQKNEFTFKCPVEHCNGFLNSSFNCGICDNKICKHCMEIKEDDTHECDEEKKKTVEYLKKDTKPCPKCGEFIHKINGCFSKDTPILMWNGTIKMSQDIEKGDILIGDDGEKRIVQNLVNGIDNMYEIKQNDGDNYLVNSKHKLTLYYSANGEVRYSKSINRFIVFWFDYDKNDISRKKFLTEEEAFKFKNKLNINEKLIDISIDSYIKLNESSKNILKGIKLDKSINWNEKSVQLDPYILGLWLGDGYSNGKEFCTNDNEILEYWNNWCKNNEAIIVERNDKFRYYIKNINNCNDSKGNKFKNPLKEKLINYGLIENKHIPQDYLINSKEIRLKVLAGVIDTDGCVQNEGRRITIITIYETLSKNIEFLAKSLGYSVHINIRKRQNVKCPNVEPKDYKDQYNINISGYNIDEIPTILKRKQCKKQVGGVNLNTTSIEIIKLDKQEYYGWEVTNNNRFILKDFTISHNCDQMYCVKCHTAFSWRTGVIERGHVHNPEYYRWMRENGRDIPRDPLDVRYDPCGNQVIDYTTLLRILREFFPPQQQVERNRYGQASNDNENVLKIANMHRMIHHINFLNNMYQNEQTTEERLLRNMRAMYLLNKITKEDFKKKLQMSDKKKNKNKKINDIWNVVRLGLIEYIGKITEIQRNENGKNIVIDIVNESKKIRKYCNNSFAKIGKMFKMTYPGINYEWIQINNWETYIRDLQKRKQIHLEFN